MPLIRTIDVKLINKLFGSWPASQFAMVQIFEFRIRRSESLDSGASAASIVQKNQLTIVVLGSCSCRHLGCWLGVLGGELLDLWASGRMRVWKHAMMIVLSARIFLTHDNQPHVKLVFASRNKSKKASGLHLLCFELRTRKKM
jgi:hypothetical protein